MFHLNLVKTQMIGIFKKAFIFESTHCILQICLKHFSCEMFVWQIFELRIELYRMHHQNWFNLLPENKKKISLSIQLTYLNKKF